MSEPAFGGFESVIQAHVRQLNDWIKDAHNHGITVEVSTYDGRVPYPVITATLSGTYVDDPELTTRPD